MKEKKDTCRVCGEKSEDIVCEDHADFQFCKDCGEWFQGSDLDKDQRCENCR